jgi:hypothetical protein
MDTQSIYVLPPEIVMKVFQCLENLDDVFRFAASCKYTHSVFNPPYVRHKIFESIIVRFPDSVSPPFVHELITEVGKRTSTCL